MPQGVSSVQILAVGAAGGSTIHVSGGAGAQVTGTLSVLPAQPLYLEVAIGGGAVPNAFTAGAGGGASDVRICPVNQNPCNAAGPGLPSVDGQLLVAAGGGGAGAEAPGAGDVNGGAGGAAGVLHVTGGDGGTRDSGGGAGASDAIAGVGGTAGGGSVGETGARGVGGAGGAGAGAVGAPGGGGGAGWRGGGGGGGGGQIFTRTGGGGGGASFARSTPLPDAVGVGGTTISSPSSAVASTGPMVQLTYTDNTAPTVTLDQLPAQTGGRPTFSGTAGIDTGDSSTVTVTLSRNGFPDQNFNTTRDSSGHWSFTPSSPLPASQNYSVVAHQSDNAGNPGDSAQQSLDVDPAAPALTLTQPANGLITGQTAPTFAGGAGNKAKDLPDVTLSLYSGPAATGTPVRTLHATAGGGVWSVPAGAPLADGTYTAVATQSDNGQGSTTTAPNSFTVDTTPPTLQISAPTEGASFSRGASPKAAFSCQDGGSGVIACTGTVASGQPLDTTTVGSHAFTVTATDRAGNANSHTVHYTVTAPGGDGGAGGGKLPSKLAVTGVRTLNAARGCTRHSAKLVKPRSKTARACTVGVVVRGTVDARAVGARVKLKATAGRRHASASVKLKKRTWSITIRLPASVTRWKLAATFAGNGSLRAGTASRTLAVTRRR